jgi:predicted DNA-binding protein with PD1-like motif
MAATRMIARGGRPGSVVVVRLAYGEDLLGSLTDICKREKIRNGVVLTGFGSLTDVTVTGVVGPAFPPRRFYTLRRPRGVEILAISGVIADYHVHVHMALCDRTRAFGGHLEPGCRILSLAEIAIMRVDGLKLARRIDPTTGQRLLTSLRRYTADGRVEPDGSLHAVQARMTRRG